jgi:phage head maturation protease
MWNEMENVVKGLRMRGKFEIGRGIPGAEKAYLVARSKSRKGMSIGYYTRKSDIKLKPGFRILQDVDLDEVSIVNNPMNPKATISSVKGVLEGEAPLTVREAESILRDVGFSVREAKCFLARVIDGMKSRDDSNAVLETLRSFNLR